MEGHQNGTVLYCGFSARKENEDIPVDACARWTEACEYCDKRFGTWLEADDETLGRVPQSPGLFMMSLRNKAVTEVVDIVIDTRDISKAAYSSWDATKERVANKKSKFTKAVIMCRWMTFGPRDDKDVATLCAHWINAGDLPKFAESWPGQETLLQKHFVFSDSLKKWCHPRKEAFWRKPQQPPTKLVEMVDGCKWTEPCEFCDSTFGKWRRVDEVLRSDSAPDASGIYLLAVNCGGKMGREVVEVCFDPRDIKLNIRENLTRYCKSMSGILNSRSKKFVDKKNVFFEVRWVEFEDVKSENCCYHYAHFLNADTMPVMNFRLPGEKVLERNKQFVVRTHDKKWCYETDVFKQARGSKSKNKRHIATDLEEDVRNLNIELE